MLIAGEAVHVVGGGGGLVARACPTLSTPWTVVCQGPLSMGFSRKEYWNGLSFPPPGDLPNPGIKTASLTSTCIGRWALCHSMDNSPPGSSVYATVQARILEWVVISSSRGSSQPRDQTQVCIIAGRFFTLSHRGSPYRQS